jgi:uncharacterized protein with von Willebrand factor type A (vWA) domain
MIRGLRRFVAELRRDGIRVSPAEFIDAVEALRLAGIESRARVRAALGATLVKRSVQRAAFAKRFDQFFAGPARGTGKERGRGARGEGSPGRGRSDRRGATVASAPPHRGEPRARRTSGPVRRPEREAESERTPELRGILDAVTRGGTRPGGRLRRAILDDRSRSGEERQPGRGARDPLRRDLRGVMRAEEERELVEAVPRLIERIRLRSGRRRRRAPSGRLYLRRVFRENISHGGVPFVLPRRRLRPRRPRVVLLVDVSWSCSRAAGLFLWMACGFLRLDRGTRVILFVDRPVEATAQVGRWLVRGSTGPDRANRAAFPGAGIAPAGRPFGDLLASIPELNLEAPSDYGRVFHRLWRSPSRPSGRDTVFVILGDGRTNRLETVEWSLDEITRRCAATLWLVPEALSQWGRGDSALAAYLPHVDLAVEARDVSGLARGVSELLRRL